MKTSDLIGSALDWAVAKAQGVEKQIMFEGDSEQGITALRLDQHHAAYSPSTDWAQGGPIIGRECISVWETCDSADPQHWSAIIDIATWGVYGQPERDESFGPTPLIAAMRCYVASKLSDEVDIPKEI